MMYISESRHLRQPLSSARNADVFEVLQVCRVILTGWPHRATANEGRSKANM